MKERIRALFAGDSDASLLYFAGHGYVESTGGYICPSDCRTGDDGVPLSEIVTLANQSSVKDKIIILDSCHSGIVGNRPDETQVAELKDGLTILTASTAEQYASEENCSGVFTNLLVDALGGAAANLMGDITPGSVYAHIDRSLGPWAQRPVFKTNVKRFISLRRVQPPIALVELQQISELFPKPGYKFHLDSTFEPERSEYEPSDSTIPAPDFRNTKTFALLQKYNRLNLLVPEGASHMWHAAMQSKSVRLTPLGEHYRRLAEKGMI